MPKERRSRSLSVERRHHTSPYQSNSYAHNPHHSLELNDKEWEEVRCPVCMEHPHNAVLLLCSSYDKGCRPFMCDTSYRHSNCLDQYRKTFSGSESPDDGADNPEHPANLLCPLCRGLVTRWTVIEPARRYMNAKSRSCSKESCAFSGLYDELRKHAREEHPSVRPSEADPERQQNWMRMEQERDLGDLFSMFHSSISGEQNRVNASDNDEEASGSMLAIPSITMFLVVHVRRAGSNGNNIDMLPPPQPFSSRRSLRALSRGQRGRTVIGWGERRVIGWGETLSNPTSSDRGTTHDSTNGDGAVNDNGGSGEVDATSQDNE
ncbi:hypothetical protein Cni_G04505 [Canna indica]|uniref:Zinc finger, RING/FYVE/PHD-type n=1 Tax=Canna indica TaxID=4628 RepID=A0AAQ3Q2R5_9LILI|nr:hypothetical protein Cni_G04505 [Canna indica]